MKHAYIKKITILLFLFSVFFSVLINTNAQTCPISFNDKPGVIGTWRGDGSDADGNATDEIVLKYVPGKTLSYTSCKWVTERQGFPFFGIVKYEVCKPVTECVNPYIQATITHITYSVNEIKKSVAKGKANGSWLYFDVQSDSLLRFWVRPKNNNNVSSNKEIDYVLWDIYDNGSYGEGWIKVKKIK